MSLCIIVITLKTHLSWKKKLYFVSRCLDRYQMIYKCSTISMVSYCVHRHQPSISINIIVDGIYAHPTTTMTIPPNKKWKRNRLVSFCGIECSRNFILINRDIPKKGHINKNLKLCNGNRKFSSKLTELNRRMISFVNGSSDALNDGEKYAELSISYRFSTCDHITERATDYIGGGSWHRLHHTSQREKKNEEKNK